MNILKITEMHTLKGWIVWYADYKYTNFNTFFSLVAITNKKQKWKSNAIRETDDIKAWRIRFIKMPEPKWKRLRKIKT